MEHIEWADKKRRSTGSRKSSAPLLSSSASAREYRRREKELLVYHRRSAEEREAAAERNRLHRLALELDAAAGLEELGHGMVYSPANRHVMSEITTSVQPTQPNQPRVYGSTAEEAVKYPGRLAFDPLFVPKKRGVHASCCHVVQDKERHPRVCKEGVQQHELQETVMCFLSV
jgi:hypothetical protein